MRRSNGYSRRRYTRWSLLSQPFASLDAPLGGVGVRLIVRDPTIVRSWRAGVNMLKESFSYTPRYTGAASAPKQAEKRQLARSTGVNGGSNTAAKRIPAAWRLKPGTSCGTITAHHVNPRCAR